MLNTSRTSFQPDHLENNDDEMERKSRRRQSEKRMSTNVTRNVQFVTDAKSKMTNYMQLFSENKIVASNVWVLNAIECLKVIVDSETNNLLNIGPDALEVGTKVYTVRVDDTYNQTLKISHDLASKVAENNLENENSNGDGGDQSQISEPKPKRIRLAASSFIVKNEKEIQGEILTKGSVFSKLLSDLNDKGEKYFMGSLPIDPRNGCQQLLFEQFDDEDYAIAKSKEGVKDDDEIDFELPTDYENIVCAPLTNHSLSVIDSNISAFFDEITNDRYATDTEGNPVVDVSFLKQQSIINRNGGNAAANDDDDDDMNNDDDNDGHFGDNDNNDMQKSRTAFANGIVGNDGNITIGKNAANELVNNLRFIDNLEPNSILICDRNDYLHAASEYRPNTSLRNMWAGPQHWKLKLMGRRPTGGSAVAERAGNAYGTAAAAAAAGARKRTLQAKRKEELVDFNEIPYSYDQYDASLVDGITKRYRCFSEDEQANLTKVCLVPIKHELTIDRLNTLMADEMTLMMLPASRDGLNNGAVAVTVADNNNSNDDDDDDENNDLVSRPIDRSHYLDDDLDNVCYNYDNPNDSQFTTPVDESFGSLGMVKAPGKIPEVKIDYDKKPSNIDIKELKNGLRKRIEEHSEIKVDFLEVFSELPEVLPSKMKRGIDLAVAFSGLLQVAYETQAIDLIAKADGGITIQKK